MDTLAKRLKQRSEHLGISVAEAGRRAGLEERRFAHYVAGRREPDLATLVRIAEALGTTPNWLLGFDAHIESERWLSELMDRFANAAMGMAPEELKMVVIQAEAITAAKAKR